MRSIHAIFCLAGFLQLPLAQASKVKIPAGTYETFFKEDGRSSKVAIPTFFIDSEPVTNSEFSQFLKITPEYQKSKILKLYAGASYLQHWKSDLLSNLELTKMAEQPVVNVSWFVARKYCESKNGRLATIEEWEYASDSENSNEQKKALDWYSKPADQNLPGAIGKSKPNKYGVHDMNGLIWEWVEDFNSVIISSDSRSKGQTTQGLYCGGGSLSAKDAAQYATFMRFAFRSGLSATYSHGLLGFRCAYDSKENEK